MIGRARLPNERTPFAKENTVAGLIVGDTDTRAEPWPTMEPRLGALMALTDVTSGGCRWLREKC